MPTVFAGDHVAPQGRFAIVVSRYNENITSQLLHGALETLTSHGVPDASIDVVWVPGAWEIPVAAKRVAATGRYSAILCLGAVIRGETMHDRYINRQVSTTLGQLAIDTGIPVLFGVLTCHTLEQAIQRSGGKAGNKGVECAKAALEMVNLFSRLPE